ncbi:hypothetical protein [Caballeronia mineralivorans]|jgi:hypothetical protein|uniref:hypothetical protein n=1 Tax=Caballeronia mineralivorans TaxID=2010198 RepID=UPI002AFE0B04|nr:hypothetical protein [Caballeronia mineralivorans]MEA3095943.1 hypothetical protein [Caballeronia mineralivorans]
MTSMRLVKTGDRVEAPAVTPTIAARAYRTGLAEGKAAEAKRAAVLAEAFKRELSAGLDQLGTALISKDEAGILTWYGCLTRMASAPADK